MSFQPRILLLESCGTSYPCPTECQIRGAMGNRPQHHSLVQNAPQSSTPFRRKPKAHLKPFQSVCHWYNSTKIISCVLKRINSQELAKVFLKKKNNKKVLWTVKEYYLAIGIKTNWKGYIFWGKKGVHVPNNFLYNSRENQAAQQMVLR